MVPWSWSLTASLLLLVVVLEIVTLTRGQVCTVDLQDICSPCCMFQPPSTQYNCSLPGLESMTPGQYAGVTVNYLSFVTETSSPALPIRAKEFEACTGGTIVFSEAKNVWEDPIRDLGTKISRGSEVYDGYFMSYSHFPEASVLELAEPLNDRIRTDNSRLKWEDVLPKVRAMSEYRRAGATYVDFLMYDGDFFVPLIRLDLLEKYNMTLPNTWEEVVKMAKFFHGKDLNDDGNEDDYGFCHFPRMGAGYWDWWWPEAMYSTWATYDQTDGMNQGFLFDEDTMEPRLGEGFRKAAETWKELWTHGEEGCITSNFITGRCAIGFSPPGCWKGIFLDPDGVSRKDANGTVIWRPTMKSGEYAEPYRFKPFGSTRVFDRTTGQLRDCTEELCPKAERIPAKGHTGDDDRARVLTPSPLSGQLVNRAPFFWSGGLGTLIRKSTTEIKKDVIWDFFVYSNSPQTSIHDVANYASWLDSWRYSQLAQTDSFTNAGWSEQAVYEHVTTMLWALTEGSNGALNLRIPGLRKYTWDGTAHWMDLYIKGEISLEQMAQKLAVKWNEVTMEEGKLSQLEVYRSALGMDAHSQVDLCRLHRDLMDDSDPSICRKYDLNSSGPSLVFIIPFSIAASVALISCLCLHRRMKRGDAIWAIESQELKFGDPPEVIGRGSFGRVLLADFRGTQVAVKHVIPSSKDQRNRKKAGELFDQLEEADPSVSNSTARPDACVIEIGAHEAAPHILRPPLRDDQSSVRSSNETSFSHQLKSVPAAECRKLMADFIQDMKNLSKLRHPCITTVMGAVISSNDQPMFVVEYMDYGSLYDILHNGSIPLESDFLLPILRDVTQGMRFLHAANPQVIHGDLRSQKVLVDSRLRAKVSDFGLSIKRSQWAGSSPWIAPELQHDRAKSTPSSDIFSFGIILHEVYSRKELSPRLIFDIITDETLRAHHVPRSCPPTISAIMTECLGGDAALRPTFEEIEYRLKRTNAEYASMKKRQDIEASRNEDLLFQVFPKHIAQALRDGRKIEPEKRDAVTVYFSDIVGFTTIAASLSPEKVSDLLDRLYLRFDELSHKHDIFKIETVGDAYMCVTNLVKNQEKNHAKLIANFAIDAIEAADQTLIDVDDPDRGFVRIRAGFHSGPVIARVVGSRTPKYGIFGDTVNTAARMESNSLPGMVQCSERSAHLLKKQDADVSLVRRGKVRMKGKGELLTYFVNPNDSQS